MREDIREDKFKLGSEFNKKQQYSQWVEKGCTKWRGEIVKEEFVGVGEVDG